MNDTTFLSINMLTPETRIYLDPPLTQVKEIQLQFSFMPKATHRNPFYLMCDLIESKSSYSNCCIPNGENEELKPSQLLAVIPSQKHPCLRVPQTKNPVNYFTLWILDEKGRKVNLNNEPFRIYLKISC